MNRRTLAFTVLAAVCATVAAVTVAFAVTGRVEPVATDKVASREPRALPARPYVVFRSLDHSRGPANFGEVAFAGENGSRRLAGLQCERIHVAKSGGLCLARARSLTGAYEARILGSDMRVRHTVKLAGVPSRARVSADGRYGSATTFVTGHSYAKPGAFSTQTMLFDMRKGTRIADVETFTVLDGGRRIDAPDVNVWGVSFTPDSDRFYATVATAGRTHLIEASVSARRGRIIRDNVECPSVSPDGKRIAYKKLVGSKVPVWRFHVLDLATGVETPLAEPKPVDDQIEWLDDNTVMYHSTEEIWTLPADGSGAPRRYLAHADSPAVVR
jgi:uncharacterized membrane protein